MSNYINVLRRLERERNAPEPNPAAPSEVAAQAHVAPSVLAREPVSNPSPEEIIPVPAPLPAPRTIIPLPNLPPSATASVTAEPTIAAPPVVPTSSARRLDTLRSRAMTTGAHPGIATLLDNIRLLATERATRVVVFSGASTTAAVEALAADLAAHAERCGMNALVATLTSSHGKTVVVPTCGSPSNATCEVERDGGTSTAELHAWIERVAPEADLVIITGPPLATSIDPALLACACDGLVIVAESEVTERAALQTAAERARIAGCRTLGVVMHGTKDRLPGWIRRLIGDSSETPTA